MKGMWHSAWYIKGTQEITAKKHLCPLARGPKHGSAVPAEADQMMKSYPPSKLGPYLGILTVFSHALFHGRAWSLPSRKCGLLKPP